MAAGVVDRLGGRGHRLCPLLHGLHGLLLLGSLRLAPAPAQTKGTSRHEAAAKHVSALGSRRPRLCRGRAGQGQATLQPKEKRSLSVSPAPFLPSSSSSSNSGPCTWARRRTTSRRQAASRREGLVFTQREKGKKTHSHPALESPESENPSGMGVSTLIFPSAQPNTCVQKSLFLEPRCCTTAAWCFCPAG